MVGWAASEKCRRLLPEGRKRRSMQCVVEQLGVIGYPEAVRLQSEKVALRKTGAIPDTLLLLEHPHVYTFGRNGGRQHLQASYERLAALGVKVFESDRGGDITYHGPGQLVGYPIFDLTKHRKDIAWYMRSLEEVCIEVARDFGIRTQRHQGAPGVWVGDDKLVAMGVHVSRWVTSHGFALNVNTDLSYFDWIVPCGLSDKGVTSLERLLGRAVPMETAIERVIEHFGEVFDVEIEGVESSRIEEPKVQSRE